MNAPPAGQASASEDITTWRKARGPKWYRDIGYTLQDIIRGHRYDYTNKGTKPNDPGWHRCSCGTWEGYWTGFEPHVADHLRAAVTSMNADHPTLKAEHNHAQQNSTKRN